MIREATDPSVELSCPGCAVPEVSYTQVELAKRFATSDAKTQRFFRHPHILKRHLAVSPALAPDGGLIEESTGVLLERFRESALRLSRQAVEKTLRDAGLLPADIRFLCMVTSTGFLVPGLSALFMKEQGFRLDCERLDLVGMGCNAGLNGLNAVTSWSLAHPGQPALLICVEICSAIYSMDASESTALVNSLFGDAAASVLVQTSAAERPRGRPGTANIIGFSSRLIPEHIGALRFDWDDLRHRYRFFIGKEAPEALASHVEAPLRALLDRQGLKRQDIKHWIIHSGGEAILSRIQAQLGLVDSDLRHTRSVLSEFGNVSSCSFLMSYFRLQNEGVIQSGDSGVFMTMGPGLTIETALVRWP